MRAGLAVVIVSLAVGVCVSSFMPKDTRAQQNTDRVETNLGEAHVQPTAFERGRYIVNHVAMCVYCHTPKNKVGVLDRQQLLQGAPMPVASPYPRQQWAFQAPKIAGLPGGWSEQDLVKFLQTGVTPTGHRPRPPMPPFRLDEEDATSVTVYLKSRQ
jgi:hypothetical protein